MLKNRVVNASEKAIFFLQSDSQMYSGIGRVVVAQARALQLLGIEVLVVIDDARLSNSQFVKDALLKYGIDTHIVEAQKDNLVPFEKKPLIKKSVLASYLLAHNPDYIFLHSWAATNTNNLVVNMAKHMESKIIFTPHFQEPESIPFRGLEMLRERVSELITTLDGSCKVLCITEWEAKRLSEYVSIQSAVIPNPVEIKKNVANETITLGSDSYGILFVGDMSEKRKHPERLIELSKYLKARDFNHKITLIGKGSKEFADQTNQDNVFGLGYVSDDVLSNEYLAANCLVIFSEFEAFCYPIAEALACGTRVICLGNGALEELWAELPGVLMISKWDTPSSLEESFNFLQATVAPKEILIEATQSRYGFTVFLSKFYDLIETLRAESKKSPLYPKLDQILADLRFVPIGNTPKSWLLYLVRKPLIRLLYPLIDKLATDIYLARKNHRH
jgi:glycosyltransferase involved in cell wall biosynthesis